MARRSGNGTSISLYRSSRGQASMHLRWRQQFIYKALFEKRAEMARKP